MSINDYFIKLSQASVILPIIFGLRVYKILDSTYKLLVGFFVFSLVIEISASVIKMYFGNNMPLLHIFTFFEFSIFAFVFLKTVTYNISSQLILVFFVIFFFTEIIDIFFLNGILKPNSTSRTFESIVMTFLALNYYFLFFKQNQEEVVWKQPMFWFSTGILIYFSLNLFLFLLSNVLLLTNYGLADIGINLHDLINIFSNALFAISFICYKKIKI